MVISIRNLKKSFGNNLVFENVNAEINRGDVIVVIGPSGCGKSTFIRCLNLLEQPDSGEIIIDGVNITKKNTDIDRIRQKMGMVFQNFNLFSHKTILENVTLAPINVLKIPKKQAIAETFTYLKMVGIANRADYMPNQLSGGQKQRAAIARCLAMHPEIILFDEPTSALDPTMVDEVLSVIRKLTKSGMTCVIVTHEMNFAKNIATMVFYMDEKGIYERGTPEVIFNNPQREKTKVFINKLKVLEYECQIKDIDIYEFVKMLTEYCQKYDLNKSERDNINLVIEELIVYIIDGAKQTDHIALTVRYNEITGEKEIYLRYTAPDGNIIENESFDEISRRLIKGFTKEISYSQKDNTNVLKMIMKSTAAEDTCGKYKTV
jgi:polar amino acid transport system ATP-binding protein